MEKTRALGSRRLKFTHTQLDVVGRLKLDFNDIRAPTERRDGQSIYPNGSIMSRQDGRMNRRYGERDTTKNIAQHGCRFLNVATEPRPPIQRSILPSGFLLFNLEKTWSRMARLSD